MVKSLGDKVKGMNKVEVGVLSELYERCLGVKSPTGARNVWWRVEK